MKRIVSLLFLIVLLACTFCKQNVETGITVSEAKALLDNAIKAYVGGDFTLIDKVWTTDYILHDPAYPQEVRGLDSLKKVFEDGLKTFKSYKLQFENLIVKNDTIVAFFKWSTTLSEPLNLPGVVIIPASGKTIGYSGIYMGKVVKGKLAEDWFFYNPLDYYLALGFTLVPPQVLTPEKK
jgi:predicted ester cyclase